MPNHNKSQSKRNRIAAWSLAVVGSLGAIGLGAFAYNKATTASCEAVDADTWQPVGSVRFGGFPLDYANIAARMQRQNPDITTQDVIEGKMGLAECPSGYTLDQFEDRKLKVAGIALADCIPLGIMDTTAPPRNGVEYSKISAVCATAEQ